MTMKSFYDVFPTADKAYFRGKAQEELNDLTIKAMRVLANEIEILETQDSYYITPTSELIELVSGIGIIVDKLNNSCRVANIPRHRAYAIGMEHIFSKLTRSGGNFTYAYKANVKSGDSFYLNMVPTQMELSGDIFN